MVLIETASYEVIEFGLHISLQKIISKLSKVRSTLIGKSGGHAVVGKPLFCSYHSKVLNQGVNFNEKQNIFMI